MKNPGMCDANRATSAAIASVAVLSETYPAQIVERMSRRFPASAFSDSLFLQGAHAALAVAPMRFAAEERRLPLSSASSEDVLVADARFDITSSIDSVRESLCESGAAAVPRLRGDFSLIYWNETDRRLIAARDHIGIRPLYYAISGDRIAASNSISAMLEVPWVTRALRPEVLGTFVVDGVVRDAERTIYVDIQRLRPGHVLQFDADGLSIERYWRMPIVFAASRRSFEDVADAFVNGLRTSVASSCAGGPVAISLSGGIDSTSIASIAASLPETMLKAYTVGSSFGEDDERDLGRQTAERFGMEWTLVDTSGAALWESWYDDSHFPFPVGMPQFRGVINFLREVAKTSSILISGEGGDEVMWQPSFPFAGSLAREGVIGIFRDLEEARRNRVKPRFGARNFAKRSNEKRKKPSRRPSWMKAPVVEGEPQLDEFSSSIGVLGHERFDAWKRLQTPMFGFMFEYLHPCFTGVPVEYRWPYLDRELIESALGLPGYPAFEAKALLRRKLAPVLPVGVIRRPKTGVIDPVIECLKMGGCAVPRLRRKPDDRFVDPDELLEEARNLASIDFPRNWMVLRALELLVWLDEVENVA